MSTELRLSVDLEKAVERGVIGEDQAIALRNLEAAERGLPLASEEPLGFSSMSDAGHCVLVALAGFTVGWFAQAYWWSWPIGLAGLWWIGTRVEHRPRLPFTKYLLFAMFVVEATAPIRRHIPAGQTSILIVSGVFALCALLWWWRFRLPALLALGVGFLAIMLGVHVPEALRLAPLSTHILRLFLALAITSFALLWDMSDVRRQTTRSSTGFWLHFAAATTFTSAFLPEIRAGLDQMTQFYPALAVAALSAFFFAVAADRRIWMLAALVVASASGSVGGALFGLGTLLLAAGVSFRWNETRRWMLGYLPNWLRAQLPRTDMIELGRRPTLRRFAFRPRDMHEIERLGGDSAFTGGPTASR